MKEERIAQWYVAVEVVLPVEAREAYAFYGEEKLRVEREFLRRVADLIQAGETSVFNFQYIPVTEYVETEDAETLTSERKEGEL